MLKKVVFVLLVVLLLGACGGKPTVENSRDIVVGQTTKSEVIDIMGEPHLETVFPSGNTGMFYFTDDDYTINVVIDGGFVSDVVIAEN